MTKIEALIKGVGSVLDISGTSIDSVCKSSGYKDDSRKIAKDWKNVGNDLRRVDKKYVRG